jgi:glycosyltransferase involved in cell wall biosynthesis
MKIAYFLGTLKKEDGVTRVLLSLINEAQKKEDPSIIVTGWAEDESISLVPIIQVPSFVFLLYKDYKIPLPGMSGFEKKLDEFKPDIIHVHSPDPSAWAALKYANKHNIPIIATYHTNFNRYLSYYHLSFLSPIVSEMLKRLYRQMNAVTSPSLTVTQELINLGIKNIETIPWGVESTKFNNSFYSIKWRNKILNGENKNIILYAGRLTWEKDFRTFVDTYKLLINKRNDFIFVIAGDGPIRKELEFLMPKAVFLGHIEGEELSMVYASSNIFFSASSTEVFANVPLEAMSSGIIPVIASVGGIKILIENKEIGLLCEPKNANDFYENINTLLDDTNLQSKMRLNGSNFIKNYTWEKVFTETKKIYSRLLS